MADPRLVHVAPLPPGHIEDANCPCEPVRSIEIGDGRLMVHRTELATLFAGQPAAVLFPLDREPVSPSPVGGTSDG